MTTYSEFQPVRIMCKCGAVYAGTWGARRPWKEDHRAHMEGDKFIVNIVRDTTPPDEDLLVCPEPVDYWQLRAESPVEFPYD